MSTWEVVKQIKIQFVNCSHQHNIIRSAYDNISINIILYYLMKYVTSKVS